MYGVYLVKAEVQEDHAREVHPDRQDGLLGMRNGDDDLGDFGAVNRKERKTARVKDPRTFGENRQG